MMYLTMPNARACETTTRSSGTGFSVLYLSQNRQAGLVRQNGLK